MRHFFVALVLSALVVSVLLGSIGVSLDYGNHTAEAVPIQKKEPQNGH